MRNLRVLERKDKKRFLELLKEQFGFEDKLDYVFLVNNKNKVYIINKDVANIELENIRINSMGLYIAELRNNEVRLSIEGSQIIGPGAKKNIIELNPKEEREWLKGRDIEKDAKEQVFVILKCNGDYIGSGKLKDGRILNFVSKIRRLNVSD